MGLLQIFTKIYWRYIASPLKYAQHIGVNIGENNLIGKGHWSSEPYLITIGNNCQLTNCKIFTHGGGVMFFVTNTLISIALVRSKSGTMSI